MAAFGEFDLHGGWSCPTDDPTEAIQQYQKTIQTRNDLWSSYLKENPDAEFEEKISYIITPALGYAGNFAECLKVVHDIEPDSVTKMSPDLRSFLEENYFAINSKYPGFVKYVLDPLGTVKIASPLQQYLDGQQSIQCRNGLESAQKASNGMRICITSDTKIKMQKRGLLTESWPYNQLKNIRNLYKIEHDKTYFVKYFLNGAELEKITLSKTTNSLTIDLKNTGIGLVAITIPRDMLDSKFDLDMKDDVDFIILMNHEEARFVEIRNAVERTIFINLEPGSKQIEIIGTYPI